MEVASDSDYEPVTKQRRLSRKESPRRPLRSSPPHARSRALTPDSRESCSEVCTNIFFTRVALPRLRPTNDISRSRRSTEVKPV